MECIKSTEFFLKIGRHSEEIHRSHSTYLYHMTRICNRSFIDRIINRAIITNCEIDKLSAAGACSPYYITVTRLYLRPIEYTCRHMRNMFLINKRGKRERKRDRDREKEGRRGSQTQRSVLRIKIKNQKRTALNQYIIICAFSRIGY